MAIGKYTDTWCFGGDIYGNLHGTSVSAWGIYVPDHTLRRRPGGNLRNAETIEQLHPRPATIASFTSSTSSYSLVIIPDRSSNYTIPSISIESPQSFLDTPRYPRYDRHSQSPAQRMSGLAMDFSAFRMPQDIESSDDENCDPAEAVEKNLSKLRGMIRSEKPSSTAILGISNMPMMGIYTNLLSVQKILGHIPANDVIHHQKIS
jgi:hypothetical protein